VVGETKSQISVKLAQCVSPDGNLELNVKMKMKFLMSNRSDIPGVVLRRELSFYHPLFQ